MIHYTLLPEKDIKILKREYKARIFITLFFFISCASILGVISLIPAYILSYYQEKTVLDDAQKVDKGREASGINEMTAELNSTNAIVKRIKNEKKDIAFSYLVEEIVKHKPNQVYITSIGLNKPDDVASSSITVALEGKALTRESLVNLKKNLESDPRVSGVGLPISDLAKSKDITFSIRFNVLTNTN